jgi:excisionase family DNA binding protein
MIEDVKDERTYTMRDALTILRISRSTLNRMLGRGDITGHKQGARWRFYGRDIKSSLQAGGVQSHEY